jgi:hypothetical protein
MTCGRIRKRMQAVEWDDLSQRWGDQAGRGCVRLLTRSWSVADGLQDRASGGAISLLLCATEIIWASASFSKKRFFVDLVAGKYVDVISRPGHAVPGPYDRGRRAEKSNVGSGEDRRGSPRRKVGRETAGQGRRSGGARRATKQPKVDFSVARNVW